MACCQSVVASVDFSEKIPYAQVQMRQVDGFCSLQRLGRGFTEKACQSLDGVLSPNSQTLKSQTVLVSTFRLPIGCSDAQQPNSPNLSNSTSVESKKMRRPTVVGIETSQIVLALLASFKAIKKFRPPAPIR